MNWHLIFLVSAPIGVFGTVWAYFMLHDIGVRKHAQMDWWGNLLFAAGLIAILVGITYGLLPYGGHPMGWTNPWVLTALFGGLTLLFHDPRILKIKPTVIDLILAAVLFGGLILRRNPLKLLMGGALVLPDDVWRTLTVRFGLLYVFLALANIVIWRTQSEATWVLFKTFGLEVMTILFALTQAPLLMKHMDVDDVPPPPPAD